MHTKGNDHYSKTPRRNFNDNHQYNDLKHRVEYCYNKNIIEGNELK